MAERWPKGPVIISGHRAPMEQATVGAGETLEVVSLATAARGREFVEAAVRSLRGRGIRAWTRRDEHPPASEELPEWWEILVRPADMLPARAALNAWMDRGRR